MRKLLLIYIVDQREQQNYLLQIRKKKATVGTFIGEKAKTIDKITPDTPGYVRFKGEYWQAKSDTTIEPNTKVIIIDKDETTLIVKPKNK